MGKKIKQQKADVNFKRPEQTYPVFCFKHLQPYSYDKCPSPGFFIDFLVRLKKLGELGWKEIHKSHKHGWGTEKIPVEKLKPENKPSIMTADVDTLTVLRANGNNLPFLGIVNGDIFQVIYIETEFGHIYDHG